MLTAARACPSCSATLATDAAFCHRCGAATPHEIDRLTGEIRAPLPSGLGDAARRAKLQHALGDDCEVRRLLGRGGFAEVYVAFDRRLKREIAVKTIRGDLVVTETLLDRFQREAEAVAKLRHPNVVPIYSVGARDGLAYFTMPLIEGDSLAVVLERDGGLSVDDGVRILREAAHALHAAHRAGIVHRDVKPENIMLEGPDRSVVVMDFGIAKSTGSAGDGLTGTGMLVGTPQYMSPEQAMGERALDARSDQYALAMVGYRMLTGRLPFDGDSVQTLLFKAVTQVPTPAWEIAPAVSKALSDVLARALSKRAEDRFDSMAAFAAALEQCQSAERRTRPGAAGRRVVDLATRVREMERTLPRLTTSLVVAIVGTIAAVALLVLATPRTPLVLAGNRDDALFAAQTLVNTQMPAVRRQAFTAFVTEDTAFRFLTTRLGIDGTDRRAARDVPVWAWEIALVASRPRDLWRVRVGPRNRIVGFTHVLPDSSAGARISADSARALALQALAARGWSTSQLQPLPDSVIARKARVDHLFRWWVRVGAVPWRGGDSARVRVRVTVAGDHVAAFAEELQLPEGYAEPNVRDSLAMAMVVTFVVGCVLAMIVQVKRQLVDELQWGTVLRLTGLALGLLLLRLLPVLHQMVATGTGTADPNGPQDIPSVVAAALSLFFMFALLSCVAVAGESLAARHNPRLLDGLGDAMRGRLLIPEMVPAAAHGYAGAALIAAVAAGTEWVVLHRGSGTPTVPRLPFSSPLIVAQLDTPAISIATVLVLLFALAALHGVRLLSRAALALPALAMAVFIASADGPAAGAGAFATTLLLSFLLWRRGMLAVLLAAVLAGVIETAVPLLRVDDGRYLAAGTVLVLLFLTPAVLAFVAHRRFASPRASVRPTATAA